MLTDISSYFFLIQFVKTWQIKRKKKYGKELFPYDLSNYNEILSWRILVPQEISFP
jgi:hypothetical protein